MERKVCRRREVREMDEREGGWRRRKKRQPTLLLP